MKRFFSALAVLAFAFLAFAPMPSDAANPRSFTQTLNTSTKTSDAFDSAANGAGVGFTVAVTGTFSANWRLQRSYDGGSTWTDFMVIDQADAVAVPAQAPAFWRISAAGGGDFTSGSASISFVKGGSDAAASVVRLLNKDRTPISSASPLPITGSMTATISGTPTVTIGSALPAGSNVLGSVTVTGTPNVANTAATVAGENHVGAVGGEAVNASGTLTKSTKTTAYSSGQLITQGIAGSSAAVAIQAARANDKTGMVRRARLKVNDSTWLNATVRVHLFKDNPTFTNGDAANFAAGISESSHFCRIDVLLDLSFSSSTVKGIGVPVDGNECNFEPSSGTRNIYAVLEARSTTAGSHTASSTFTLTLETLQN